MIRTQSLSYDESGILYLDEWDRAETDEEEAAVGEGTTSTPLGHINNPLTGLKVPPCLCAEWDELVEEWATWVAERLSSPLPERAPHDERSTTVKIAIESTPTITSIEGAPCRLWRGTTEAGTEVWVFVRLISVSSDADTEGLDAELIELVNTPGGKFIPIKELHS